MQTKQYSPPASLDESDSLMAKLVRHRVWTASASFFLPVGVFVACWLAAWAGLLPRKFFENVMLYFDVLWR